MKYELNLKIEGDEVIRGVRINFIGEDGFEVLPDVVYSTSEKTRKTSPKGDNLDNVDSKSKSQKRKSTIIENEVKEIPPEMYMEF